MARAKTGHVTTLFIFNCSYVWWNIWVRLIDWSAAVWKFHFLNTADCANVCILHTAIWINQFTQVVEFEVLKHTWFRGFSPSFWSSEVRPLISSNVEVGDWEVQRKIIWSWSTEDIHLAKMFSCHLLMFDSRFFWYFINQFFHLLESPNHGQPIIHGCRSMFWTPGSLFF